MIEKYVSYSHKCFNTFAKIHLSLIKCKKMEKKDFSEILVFAVISS